MVSDPEIEVSHLSELKRLTEVVGEEKGQQAVDELTIVIARRMASFARDVNALFDDMLPVIKRQG
jgi:hypothetical protein